MNKHHITSIIAGLMIIAGAVIGRWNFDFFLGIITGICFWMLITATLGQWLMSKHQERTDKLTRDRLEGGDY